MKNIRCICCAIVVFASPILAQDGGAVILENSTRSENPNVLRIGVSGGDYGFSDETLIFFREDAEFGIDILDSEKFFSLYPDATMIWSECIDGTALAMNALPLSCLYDGLTSVQVYFQCGYDDEYTFSFSGLEDFEYPTEFWLEDRCADSEWYNMSRDGDSYTFEGCVDDSSSYRFVMHFMDPTGLKEILPPINFKDNVKIYATNSFVYIENKSDKVIEEVAIFNIMGQQILRQRVPAQQVHKFNVSENSGYYIIQAVSGAKKASAKIYIQ